MPIRFRCERCGQLLGIARRKAGTFVNCPTCRHQLTVPQEDQVAPAAVPQMELPQQRRSGPPSDVFDRDDFDVFLAAQPRAAPAAAPPRPAPQPPAPAPAPSPLSEPPPALTGAHSWPQNGQPPLPAGSVVLSPGRATLLTIIMILLLAVSFVAGLLVGRFVL